MLAAFGGFAAAPSAVLARGDDPLEPPGAALRAAAEPRRVSPGTPGCAEYVGV